MTNLTDRPEFRDDVTYIMQYTGRPERYLQAIGNRDGELWNAVSNLLGQDIEIVYPFLRRATWGQSLWDGKHRLLFEVRFGFTVEGDNETELTLDEIAAQFIKMVDSWFEERAKVRR